MSLLNYVIDFIQKEALNSFLVLVTALFQHILHLNLWKHGNTVVQY